MSLVWSWICEVVLSLQYWCCFTQKNLDRPYLFKMYLSCLLLQRHKIKVNKVWQKNTSEHNISVGISLLAIHYKCITSHASLPTFIDKYIHILKISPLSAFSLYSLVCFICIYWKESSINCCFRRLEKLKLEPWVLYTDILEYEIIMAVGSACLLFVCSGTTNRIQMSKHLWARR